MLTVICVLKSGGIYDAKWVRKLRDGVARKLKGPHRFACLSDVDVPCERIPLIHDWPGWWSKIELFRPGVVSGPTLYLDLDNVPVGDLAPLASHPHDFAMLRNFNRPEYASSCVMWFLERAPAHVYDKFAARPDHWMTFHMEHKDGPYLGDQAFVWDCFDRNVPFLDLPRGVVASYRKDVMPRNALPENAVMVAFGGSLKPSNVRAGWLERAWI